MTANIAYKHKSKVDRPLDTDPDSSSLGPSDSLASSPSAWRYHQCGEDVTEADPASKVRCNDSVTDSLLQSDSLLKSFSGWRDSQQISKENVNGSARSAQPLNHTRLKAAFGNGRMIAAAAEVCSKSNTMLGPENLGWNDRSKYSKGWKNAGVANII